MKYISNYESVTAMLHQRRNGLRLNVAEVLPDSSDEASKTHRDASINNRVINYITRDFGLFSKPKKKSKTIFRYYSIGQRFSSYFFIYSNLFQRSF